MARDFDFRVKRVINKTPVKSVPVTTASTNTAKSGSNALLWTILVLLLIAAAIGIWQFTISTTSSTTPVQNPDTAKVASPTTNPNSTEVKNNILSPQTFSPLVQIYDSGAGSKAVSTLVEELKMLGYKVDNLDKSQFNYDRTYIRYRAGMLAEAEKIQAAMPERLVSLKEVVTAGLFDILILYGSK
ncbi:MAG: LytR C-terminal domain-containing protein [Candidatus Berkelbacteria bacterium]|nr:LytR C-terminal domain-containing protein [Candidatus Berkelbacteria bacterium]MCR4307543.1 LytR C-terminal domain-containing protein [Candidatus Berkelbacteria bacterium]